MDGHGRVVPLAQDCEARNAPGNKVTGGPLDDSMSDVVDNVVEAIYRRAKEGKMRERESNGAAMKKKEEGDEQIVGNPQDKKRKRTVEEAELSCVTAQLLYAVVFLFYNHIFL